MTNGDTTWRSRLRGDLRERLHRIRLDAVLAAQSGVAAGLAWFVAYDLLGHPQPFFAPVAAVIVLGATVGQRWRRAAELVFGVAIGIAVGDALILAIGVGVVQIAAVVALAILLAIFLGAGSVAMGQAASSAVLVATLSPPTEGITVERFVDALIGGIVGIAVMALLLPFNPLTRVRRAADRALTALAGALLELARALAQRDPTRADQALRSLREREADHARLRETLDVGHETVTIAPMRWRSKPALALYMDASAPIDRATRNVRVLARRVAVLMEEGEPVPPALAEALRRLAEAVLTLRRELAHGTEPVRSREIIGNAIRLARIAYTDGVGFSGTSVVAQIRSAGYELLLATGMPEPEAGQLVRAAAAAEGSDATAHKSQ